MKITKISPLIETTTSENQINKVNTENSENENFVKSIDRSLIAKPELSVKPYTILSEEYYLEHKDSVIHCKHSPDGNYIASIDINGIIKS
jgi:hypothetical protein